MTVHPHVHGELLLPPLYCCINYGSSPRAWGTRSLCCYNLGKLRFIPTCMGNSNFRPSPGRQWFGSSPRAWGTHQRLKWNGYIGRFIPTCMGNSIPVKVPGEISMVHPHVHGELTRATRPARSGTGSSPRAWGTRYMVGFTRDRCWFIPTCMGNSSGELASTARPSVHPHVHGELKVRMDAFLKRIGSSPRAWGTLSATCSIPNLSRFIPTCMGNSMTACR